MTRPMQFHASDPDQALAFIRAHTRPRPVPLCPELSLHQVEVLSDLWQAGEAELGAMGVEIPFWATPWPGGQALARFLLDQPAQVRGARVLDLGTGSGLCALAAMRAGAARVTAMDVDPVACAAAALNATLNGVTLSIVPGDPLASPPPEDIQVILAADLWYDRWMARRVTPWLRTAAAAGVRVLAGDLGRAYLPRSGLVELDCFDVPTSPDLERDEITETRVFLWGAAA